MLITKDNATTKTTTKLNTNFKNYFNKNTKENIYCENYFYVDFSELGVSQY